MVDQPFQQDQELADDDIKHCYIIILLLTHLNLTTTTMILPVVPFWHLSLASCVSFFGQIQMFSFFSIKWKCELSFSREKAPQNLGEFNFFTTPLQNKYLKRHIYCTYLHTEPGRR